MIKNKKQMYLVIGAFALIMLLGGVTYAFFNYTRTGASNTIRTGQINFLTTQSNTLNLTNVFPMSSTQAESTNLDAVSVRIQGDTTYAEGEEFEISIVEVNDTIGSGANAKRIPLNYIASYAATPVQEGDPNVIGTSSNSYFSSRGSTNTVYKLSATGEAINGQQVLVGYIPTGETGIDGTLTIKAYIDSDKIAISDTYPEEQEDTNNDGYIDGTTSTWVAGRTVLTTSEWNALQNTQTPLSFKIKAVSNEGTWVEQQPMPTSCFTYTEANNEITITAYDNTCGLDVMIPDTINGKNVTKIGTKAFESMGLTSVKLPQYLTVIGMAAFGRNNIGGEVIIPQTVTEMGSYAFTMNQISKIVLSSNLSSLNDGVFNQNQISGELIIPQGITSIGDSAFQWNPITRLSLPNSVLSIGATSFAGSQISNLTIPNSVTTIGGGAFGSCPLTVLHIDMTSIPANIFNNNGNSIQNLTLGEHVTSIGSQAFSSNPITTLNVNMETIPNQAFDPASGFGQGMISSLTIGTNVKTINANAFTRNRIASVTIPSNVETMKCNAFDNQQNSITTNITYEQSGFTCTN